MAGKPTLGEIAQADHGIRMAKAYTAMLLENPDSVLQQRGRDMTLYDGILRDDQVKSCFQQRRLAVTQSEWEVEPASESAEDKAAAEFIKEQLQHNVRFDDITDKMLFGIFYGYVVAECMWERDGNQVGLDSLKVRERSRFKFDLGSNLRLINIDHPNGLLLPERKFWIFNAGADHSDNPYGVGLAHSLYWPAFFKRNGIKFWLIFLEKFGMPTATAKLPPGQSADPIERDNKISALGYEPTEDYVTETYGAGWKKKDKSPLPPVDADTSELPPEFSEISSLTQKRAAHRADMQAIVDAAEYLGTKYQEMYAGGWKS